MGIVNRLIKFRKACEQEAGAPATDIEVPLSHALDDVCRALNVTKRQRRKIVGKRNLAQLKTTTHAPNTEAIKR